jgi:MraZ protein
MALQTGTFESTLDDKGRVNIPVFLRQWYGGIELVITQGMQASVWIMNCEVWEHMSGKLMNSDALTEEESLLLQYQHILPAQAGEIDKSGRLAIPPAIRRYAQLTKNCLVLSAKNHLEIWDAEFFYSYLNANKPVSQRAWEKMGSVKLFSLE